MVSSILNLHKKQNGQVAIHTVAYKHPCFEVLFHVHSLLPQHFVAAGADVAIIEAGDVFPSIHVMYECVTVV
jgi:hypothetical protein